MNRKLSHLLVQAVIWNNNNIAQNELPAILPFYFDKMGRAAILEKKRKKKGLLLPFFKKAGR